MRDTISWARLLAFVTGLVNQQLLVENELSVIKILIGRGINGLRRSRGVKPDVKSAAFKPETNI
jgi:hypothetical protein